MKLLTGTVKVNVFIGGRDNVSLTENEQLLLLWLRPLSSHADPCWQSPMSPVKRHSAVTGQLWCRSQTGAIPKSFRIIRTTSKMTAICTCGGCGTRNRAKALAIGSSTIHQVICLKVTSPCRNSIYTCTQMHTRFCFGRCLIRSKGLIIRKYYNQILTPPPPPSPFEQSALATSNASSYLKLRVAISASFG